MYDKGRGITLRPLCLKWSGHAEGLVGHVRPSNR